MLVSIILPVFLALATLFLHFHLLLVSIALTPGVIMHEDFAITHKGINAVDWNGVVLLPSMKS